MDNRFISEALKSLRQYYRLTQVDLAEELEMSKSAISDIETGSKPVSLNTVQRYADWAGVSVTDIFVLAEAYKRRESQPSPADLVLRVYEWFNGESPGKAKSKHVRSDDDTTGGDSGNGDNPSFDSRNASLMVNGDKPAPDGSNRQAAGNPTSGAALQC